MPQRGVMMSALVRRARKLYPSQNFNGYRVAELRGPFRVGHGEHYANCDICKHPKREGEYRLVVVMRADNGSTYTIGIHRRCLSKKALAKAVA